MNSFCNVSKQVTIGNLAGNSSNATNATTSSIFVNITELNQRARNEYTNVPADFSWLSFVATGVTLAATAVSFFPWSS